MLELIIFGILAYGFYNYKSVRVVTRLFFFVISVLGLIILTKIGFVSVFLETLLMIPINMAAGIFGIFKALLVG